MSVYAFSTIRFDAGQRIIDVVWGEMHTPVNQQGPALTVSVDSPVVPPDEPDHHRRDGDRVPMWGSAVRKPCFAVVK